MYIYKKGNNMITTIISGIILYFVIKAIIKFDRYSRNQEEMMRNDVSEFAEIFNLETTSRKNERKEEKSLIRQLHNQFYEFNRHQACQYFDIKPYIKIDNNINTKKFKPIKKQYWPQRNIRTNI